MPEDVVVLGCGVITPVGLSVPETAASARSRTQRLGEIDWRDNRFRPFTVATVPDIGLPDLHPDLAKAPLTYRETRMVPLAHVAWEEATKGFEPDGPVPLVLGLPEHEAKIALRPSEFVKRLAQQCKAQFDPKQTVTISKGRASGLMAINEAVNRLQQGKIQFAVVGAVDCLVDLYILGTLDLQKRIRNNENSDGFAPGEGAAMLLLSTAKTAAKHKTKPIARVVASGTGEEPGHLYSDGPYQGEALAEAVEALLEQAGDQPPIQSVYASFNGERYWGKEWGVAFLRHRDRFAPAHQMEHPAEVFGDLGAAHGAVMLALACYGIQRGYRGSPSLVFASSDYGNRAAVLVSRI